MRAFHNQRHKKSLDLMIIPSEPTRNQPLSKPEPKQKQKQKPLDCAQLEDRILYSATPLDPALFDGEADHGDLDKLLENSDELVFFELTDASPAPHDSQEFAIGQEDLSLDFLNPDGLKLEVSVLHDEAAPIQLIFVDESVDDYQLLIDDIVAHRDPRSFEIVRIDSSSDGVDQITDTLGGRHDVAAVHIVSHGSAGQVQLGSSILSQDNLAGYASDLTSWSDALSEDADVLFYGCDLAGDEAGEGFVDVLSHLLDADVAASDDMTGHGNLGGDWEFEYVVGVIETDAAFSTNVQQSWQHVLDITSNLVAHYEFNEGSGSTLVDSSATGNDGTLLGSPSWTAGQIGSGALDFSGDFDRVEIADNAATDFGSGDFSVGFWFNSNSPSASVSRLVGDLNGGYGFVFYESSGTLNFLANSSGGSATTSVGGLFDGNWHHVVGTRSGSDFNLYVDGSLASNVNAGAVTSVSNAETLRIGASSSSHGDYDGLIDEVRLYDRALSSDDVTQLFAFDDVGPAQTIPIGQSINEDQTLVFSTANGNAITVSDETVSDARVQVTLEVSNGTLRLNNFGGYAWVQGSNDSSLMTLEGTESAINAALEDLTYTPNVDYNGSDNLVIKTAIDADLEAYYTFEGGTADDQSASAAQNGVLVGGADTIVDGSRGEVLNLGAAGEYVRIDNLYGNPANVTLAAWVNFSSVATNGGEVISLGNDVALRINDWSQGVTGFFYDGSTHQYIGSGTNLSAGQWHHVAFTFDDTNNVQRLYIDGELAGTGYFTSSINYTG